MQTGKREDFLIHKLRQQTGFITVASLARELDISTKTIYRLIGKINQEAGQELIEAAKGKGIRLNYAAYLESRYHQHTAEAAPDIHYNFSPVERRLHIIKKLLFHAPLSLREMDLFAPYYLSTSAIYADEELIGRMLAQYGLTLQKKDNRLAVTGAEHQIRQGLIHLLTKLNLLDFENLTASSDLSPQHLQFARRQLELIEQEIDSIIPAPYNVNLLTHLYILICRASRRDFDQPLPQPQAAAEHSPYWELARKVKANIEGYLCQQLPDAEALNIASYLTGSRIESDTPALPLPDEARQITEFYVQEFARRLEVNATIQQVGQDLISHIAPMLHRLRHGLIVSNPLLDDIQQEYADIYHAIRVISTQAAQTFALPSINDDEAGFITLYFARYMESNPRRLRVLIICTTGLGTSELLRTKVSRFFPELDIVGTASLKTVTPAYLAEKNIDFILTTVKLQEKFPLPTLLVNTLFIERDKENLRQIIQNHKNKAPGTEMPQPVFTLENVPDKKALFRSLIQNAPQELQQQAPAIITALCQREKLGDTCIAPGIALAHAQIPEISAPYLAATIIQEPVPWDQEGNPVHIVIMILLPMIPAASSIHQLHDLMHKLADEELTDKLAAHPTPENLRQYLFN
ncbi:Transcriptional antiterminator [Selenomonas ruminantium]|uniref:Transcriptional antiterminator n=1 Tax=Selenomonas ruminantium TaxID=971 RepID=A0A1M6TWY0_SELRU|nr:PTS sugar transporter subunit IIA [Selenomonas ruminantium]SHK61403.1 Transcriptional antiterminator [Selenomonas ruminantium]